MKKVLAALIILNFYSSSFGQNTESYVDNSNNQEVKNLTAFAKAYGYIRFFYPNQQTKDFNWDAFLVYGTREVRSLKTDSELKAVLSNLFSPIAPYAIFSNSENTRLKVKPISQGDSITFWQHSSISISENLGAKLGGDGIKILVTTAFDSSKLIQPDSPLLQDTVQFEYVDYFNDKKFYYPDNFRHVYDPKINNKYILKKQPDPSVPFSSRLLFNGLWVTMPIALYHQEAKHLTRKAEIETFSKMLEEFYTDKSSMYQDDDISYADFVLTWNVIHHFYPYRKRSERMFDFLSSEQLPIGLKQISNTVDKKRASYNAVENYVSLFQDPHANVYVNRAPSKKKKSTNAPKRVRSSLPFHGIFLKGKVYVLRSLDPKMKNGDEILEINSKDVSVLIDNGINSGLGSPHNVLLNVVGNIGTLFNSSKGVVKLKRDNEILIVEVNTIPLKEYNKYYYNPFEHKAIEYPDPNTIYINPKLLSQGELNEAFGKIVEAEHLIVDLRGYPNSIKSIFEHLPIVNGFLKGLIISGPLNMYPNQEQQYHIWDSSLKVLKKPFINARISVLIGSSTISRGETFASYLKYAGATLIGDSNTAGASGGIHWFTTPGRIVINLTSSYTLRQNGEEMQTIGITPDILVQQTLEGLKEGKDQVYEAALKRIQRE